MSLATSFWEARYHPARAFLFLRGFYLLLACDLWFEMLQHGGRYGVGGFNVAHFASLDWLLPLPSSRLYVGMLIAAGSLALQLCLGPACRALRLVLAALYTLAWMLSMHDSYQHHYLLSWLLLWAAAYPDPRARELDGTELVRGWGLPMTAVSCAVVYVFTGISKSEADWRAGDVLRVLSKSRPSGAADPGKLDTVRDLLLHLGLSEAQIWQLLASSTIALQWTIALGYLAAPRRDERPTRLRIAIASAGLLSALAFHTMAEVLELFEIGLFSYYMVLIAILLLGPRTALAPLGRGFARASQWLNRAAEGASSQRASGGRVLLALGLLAAIGWTIPLPGARAATVCLALIGLIRLVYVWRAGRPQELEHIALSTAISTIALWVSLTQTSVPFDYYRRAAGELQHMGQLSEALSAYRMAERYAPKGRSRLEKIRALEAELARERER